ncbi:MAG: NAD-dependent epimerase/dehydratase family protein [Candidatus Helarchaeota archaeon]
MYNTIVVFGGSGFLGGYVVNELERRNYEKIIVSDLRPSSHLKSAKFIKCNILDYKQVLNAIPDDVDVVYNFAGFANLDKSPDFPIDTIKLNILGNIHVLEAAKEKKADRYIFASSAYAMSDKGSFYGISKLASEKLIEEYKKRYNLKYTIIRYGSVYSERKFENNYIYNLLDKAIKEKKIIHEGDGSEIREYIHAADAANLSVNIIESKSFENQHLILTGMERIKRRELFELINEILGNELEIIYKEDGYKDHYKFTPYSFSPAASKKLVCNPYIDLGQGILECIKHIKYKTSE